MKEEIYYVKGMHCASCEAHIERTLLEVKGIEAADVSLDKGTALVEFSGEKPEAKELTELFLKQGYVFSQKPFAEEPEKFDVRQFLISLGIAGAVIFVFSLLGQSGMASIITVSSASSLAAFFVFGLAAGASTCAALVGGIMLSMAKQWSRAHAGPGLADIKKTPYVLFNAGRIFSYLLFGLALGALGSFLKFSLTFSSLLVVLVSVVMLGLGLQMTGVKAFRRFQLTMPRFITRYAAEEKHFSKGLMPFAMGALTVVLPCGFTLTVQSLALISGSALQGGLMMLFFALGTAPALMAIGFSSAKFLESPKWSGYFLKTSGFLVLFFALFNINAQLNVLGIPSINLLAAPPAEILDRRFADVYGGQNYSVAGSGEQAEKIQVIKMDASGRGYSPDYFRVKKSVPVRWEITDRGTSGCTNAVVSRNLFSGEISLKPGEVSTKEFVPQKTGKFSFSCWMGMYGGVIEVVD